MRIKNLEHATFVRLQSEVTNSIAEMGMPALFVNTLNDIEKIAQQNEFLNGDVRLWLMGDLPNYSWVDLLEHDLSQDRLLINQGETLNYSIQRDQNLVNLSVCRIENVQLGLVTNAQPILTIVVCNIIHENGEFEFLRLLSENLPWIYLLDFNENLTPAFKKELAQKNIQVDIKTISNEEEGPLNIWQYLNDTSVEKRSLFQNVLSVNQLNKALKTLSIIAKKEQSNVVSKKTITQQKINLIPDSRNNSVNEIPQKIKQVIQQYLTNYEKSTLTHAELFNQSNGAGGLKVHLQEIQWDSLNFLEIEKSKNLELKLDPVFHKKLMEDVYQTILKKCATDTTIFMDTLNMLEKEIDVIFEQNGILFQRPNLKYITQNDIDYFLSQSYNREIDYTGTAPNKGMYEYFSAARKFQMGFFMMASVFGVTGLIRKYQYISIPLSIILLGYGIINVSKSVTRERIENHEKETKAAKEAIERWIKDLGSDISRIWTKTLTDAFRTQLSILSSETESMLKTTLLQKQSENEDERKKQQKSIQIFEQTERKLENTHKAVQNIERNIQRILGDSKTAYNQLLRAERDVLRDSTDSTERRSARSDRRSQG